MTQLKITHKDNCFNLIITDEEYIVLKPYCDNKITNNTELLEISLDFLTENKNIFNTSKKIIRRNKDLYTEYNSLYKDYPKVFVTHLKQLDNIETIDKAIIAYEEFKALFGNINLSNKSFTSIRNFNLIPPQEIISKAVNLLGLTYFYQTKKIITKPLINNNKQKYKFIISFANILKQAGQTNLLSYIKETYKLSDSKLESELTLYLNELKTEYQFNKIDISPELLFVPSIIVSIFKKAQQEEVLKKVFSELGVNHDCYEFDFIKSLIEFCNQNPDSFLLDNQYILQAFNTKLLFKELINSVPLQLRPHFILKNIIYEKGGKFLKDNNYFFYEYLSGIEAFEGEDLVNLRKSINNIIISAKEKYAPFKIKILVNMIAFLPESEKNIYIEKALNKLANIYKIDGNKDLLKEEYGRILVFSLARGSFNFLSRVIGTLQDNKLENSLFENSPNDILFTITQQYIKATTKPLLERFKITDIQLNKFINYTIKRNREICKKANKLEYDNELVDKVKFTDKLVKEVFKQHSFELK